MTFLYKVTMGTKPYDYIHEYLFIPIIRLIDLHDSNYGYPKLDIDLYNHFRISIHNFEST